MFIYHIVKFYIPCHGGAEGGAPLLNTQMNIRFRKTRFFDLKIAYECDKRPTIAPPCMPKVAPPSAPPFHRPTIPPMIAPPLALKIWVFHKNEADQLDMWASRGSPPPHAPPHVLPLKS